MPPGKRGRPKKEPEVKKSSEDPAFYRQKVLAPFKSTQATRLIDKNARSMVKLSELMDLTQKNEETSSSSSSSKNSPAKSGIEKDKSQIAYKKIEQLKKRISRRLVKLTKWADAESYEKQYHARSHLFEGQQKKLIQPGVDIFATAVRA